jgi:hypothetical protein
MGRKLPGRFVASGLESRRLSIVRLRPSSAIRSAVRRGDAGAD